jgi:hypothetical protein
MSGLSRPKDDTTWLLLLVGASNVILVDHAILSSVARGFVGHDEVGGMIGDTALDYQTEWVRRGCSEGPRQSRARWHQ